MKKLIVLFIYLLPFLPVTSQEDVNWIFGYQSQIPNDSFMGVQMTFIDDSFSLTKFTIPFSQGPSAVISNSAGELIAYSNSCDIANSMHDIMPNGDGLNPGHVHDYYCEGNLGSYPVSESGLLLGTNDEVVYMLHIALSRQFVSDIIYQTKIERINQEYVVTEKNNILLDRYSFPFQPPFSSRIDACRHGNGRDWWVIVPHAYQGHYVGLLSNDGIDTFLLQEEGIYTREVWDVGQSVFSPDGTIYGRCDIPTQVQLMDFDRCDGTLTNARSLRLDIPVEKITAIGMAFSPDSRFLYVSTSIALVQFDLHAQDVEASQVLVGEYDGFNPSLPVTFYQMQLAPNGKIYMSCTFGCTYLHVIHSPNERGLACNFEQRGVRLPVNNAYEVPNIPNFKLGTLNGSVCDSLTSTVNSDINRNISVSPNPTDGLVKVTGSHLRIDTGVRISLFDITGKRHHPTINYKNNNEIVLDMEDLSSGLFLIQLELENRVYSIRVLKH